MGSFRALASQAKAVVLSQVAARHVNLRLDTPTCSITFDDVPKSAVENGVPVLLRQGVPATFYVASGLKPADGFLSDEDIRELSRGGFDIGCHTFSHYRLSNGSYRALAQDADRNCRHLEELEGVRIPRDFSYPYGEVSAALKQEMSGRYATLRSSYAGVNGGHTDLTLLRANPIYSHSIRWSELEALRNDAVKKSGWLILYTHGVEDSPDAWGCTAGDLERAIELCKSAGMIFKSVRDVSQELFPAFKL